MLTWLSNRLQKPTPSPRTFTIEQPTRRIEREGRFSCLPVTTVRLTMKRTDTVLPRVFAAALLLLAAAISAGPTYPGENGRTAFIAGPDVHTMNTWR
jgi:hypothetical protein